MIGELAIALKLLDSTFVACQTMISKKAEVEDMAAEVGKFFTAKERVEVELAKQKNKNPDDLMEGSALEEAIKIQQAEDRMTAMMDKLSAHYSRKLQSHKWVAIKKNAAIIEAKRKKEAAKRSAVKNEEQVLIEQLAKLVLGMIGAVIVIAGVVFLILGSGAE
tara:strand:- start:369 stop:857 length:489 start_codon:yes stop_codon:yes gene_type:complete